MWCRGDTSLLQRTAHQALRYGQSAGCLLLHAGYKLSTDGQWVSDLVIINTRRHIPYFFRNQFDMSCAGWTLLFLSQWRVQHCQHGGCALARRRTVHPLRLHESSPEPAPRAYARVAYHTLVELDHYLVLFGGRSRDGLLSGNETLAVFDSTTKCWTLIGMHRQ